MNKIQTDLSEQGLITAIRANLCDFYRYLSRSLEERDSPDELFTRWCTSLAHPWFNGVLSSRAALEGDETFIEQTLEYFRSVGEVPDARMGEAIEVLRSKQQPDGTWLLENSHPGKVHFALEDGDGRPSRWNTLRALRVLNWYQQSAP